MSIVTQAIELAAKAHENQYRKSTTIPYISHPFTVGMLLLKAGCREEVVAAGILHDVIEDTEVTINEIKHQFGDEVAKIVLGCSEPDKSKSWEERKRHTIIYLKTASYDIKLVACADKLHNLSTIMDASKQQGERVWDRFKRGKEQQAWYYKNVLKSLLWGLTTEQKEAFLFQELQLTIEQVFN
ncbi:HD domain-containing protein [Bacillus taeanensis]|uniref:Phosphohydrolase n=1 Tax=Bacillus taeanensis TaxID=273032 RepID=A0A366XXB1_9BACI|nr:HD domain-containing protein [Bacillus taeanensis]RBW71030.1 phosphohydrolase [Bacillus taeanensis]